MWPALNAGDQRSLSRSSCLDFRKIGARIPAVDRSARDAARCRGVAVLSSVRQFLIGYPGALCGAAFTSGIAAEIGSQSIAWGALLIAGGAAGAFLFARGARAPRTPVLESRGTPRGAASRRVVIAVLFFLLGAARYRAAAETRGALSPPPHGPVTILGTVVRPPLESIGGVDENAGADTSLEVVSHAWPRAIRVIGPTPLSGVRGGDTVRVTGVVSLSGEPRHPGEPGAALSLIVRARLRENVQLAPFDGNHWARAVGKARQHLYDVVEDIYAPPARGYVLSILLGDRRLLSPRLKDALLYTGTYHFLSISGLHVGLVMFVVLRVPLPRRWRLSLRLLFLAAFAVLTGADPPVLRATLLFGLMLLSATGSRCPRPLNTLGWTALLLLAWNPDSAMDVGFQLSFVAVLALTVVHPRIWPPSGDDVLRRQLRDIENRLTRTGVARRTVRWLAVPVRWVRMSLAVSTTAFLGTNPLVLHHFHRLQLLSPLWNLVAYPFTFWTLLGGMASLGLGSIHPDLARPAALVVEALLELMAAVLEWGSSVPASTIHIPAPGIPVLVLSYVFLGLWIALPARSARVTAGLLSLAVASTATLIPQRAPAVWTFDARHGGASLIAPSGSEAVLIDAIPAGAMDLDADSIAGTVLATGHRRLRVLALPHPRSARADAVMTLRDRLDIAEVWVSPQFRGYPAGRGSLDQLTAAGVPWRVVGRGSRLVSTRGEETSIEIVYPRHGDGLLEVVSERDTSLVIQLVRAGRRVLFTGALGDPGIARLISLPEESRADVLVFPRGGPERRLWAELLSRVAPRHVILIGRGGAEDDRLARRIEKRGYEVLATWRGGDVVTAWVHGRGWVPRYWVE